MLIVFSGKPSLALGLLHPSVSKQLPLEARTDTRQVVVERYDY